LASEAFNETENVAFYGHLPEAYKNDLATFHYDWATFMDTHPLDDCFQKGAGAWLRWAGAAGYQVTSVATAPRDILLLDLMLRDEKQTLAAIAHAELSNEVLFRFW